MAYWLLKSEPKAYSVDNLKLEKVGMWDGVRNYQARNFMKDMKKGDKVLFYHSRCELIGIAGRAEVAREAHPDPTQFEKGNHHYDPKSTTENPRWVAVDIKFKQKLRDVLTLSVLKNDPFFQDMRLTQRGSRLSVQPVLKKHYERILKLSV